MRKTTLIVMAIPDESQGMIEKLGLEVLYTGVGKLNAAYTLLERLHDASRPVALVLNLGSAGSATFATGALVAANSFVQRDMDATGLGMKHGETPFDPHPFTIKFDKYFHELPHGVCGSGDSFLQGKCPVGSDIIDMEAYALARVCYLQSVPFACAKYITDGADDSAHLDWRENLVRASHAFAKLLTKTQLAA